jgi:hypothetical protein
MLLLIESLQVIERNAARVFPPVAGGAWGELHRRDTIALRGLPVNTALQIHA